MVDLQLDIDEGVLLEANQVTRINSTRDSLDSLVLTNKNIYCVKNKSTGLFSKPETEITIRPLSEIKILNGQLMVSKAWDEYDGFVLQVQYVDGREQYSFDEITGRIATKWVNEIHKLLTGSEAPTNPTKQSDTVANAVGALAGFAASLKSAADSAMQTATDTAKQVADSAASSVATVVEQYQESQLDKQPIVQTGTVDDSLANQRVRFCSNCGTKLESGTKFCPGCGTQVASLDSEAAKHNNNPVERQQEFAGVVLKCPNCGVPINQTTAICPDCGYRITGQAAVSSVQSFSNELMQLELKRKSIHIGKMMGLSVDPVDKQKLSLIQSFPIPNTIDDIQEFLLLAVANIDVAISKNTLSNRQQRKMKGSLNTNITMPREISDAWVSKMQQAYQKAKLSFPGDPAFESIKQVYESKMRELKMPVE